MLTDLTFSIIFLALPLIFLILGALFKEDKVLKWLFLCVGLFFLVSAIDVNHYIADLGNETLLPSGWDVIEMLPENYTGFPTYSENATASWDKLHNRLDTSYNVLTYVIIFLISYMVILFVIEIFGWAKSLIPSKWRGERGGRYAQR